MTLTDIYMTSVNITRGDCVKNTHAAEGIQLLLYVRHLLAAFLFPLNAGA